MSALTYLQSRQEHALGRAFALAFAVHAVLLAVMFLGVRWQSHPAETVTVELWEPPPPPPPEPVVEAPKPPPPKVEPPKPEPEVRKPDIVVEKAPPKPKPKPKPEPKAVPPKDDEFQKRLMREQLALEERKLDEERRRAEDEKRRLDEARRKADAERAAREAATAARNKALSDYENRIRIKVRQGWILPQDLQGNPEAVFDVVQLPSGDVISVKLSKTSGNPAYDAAVERAILKASPLPLPEPRSLFARQLKLTFRPRD
ncbi:MAG TPA: energy transducer TonB [Burkholderiales bacterium]|nr:energy transducer TonB [Burkholderiales bacterium]